MFVGSIALVILIIFVFYYKYKKPKKYSYSKRCNAVSGLPLVGIAHLLANPKEFFKFGMDIYLKDGPNLIIDIGPFRRLLICELDLLESILSSTKYIDKSSDYKFFERWFGDSLLNSTGYKWKSHRKVITPTFHLKILEQFIQIFNKESAILVKQLNKEISKDSFDAYEYLTLYTLDVICESAMGIYFNVQHNPTHSFNTNVKEICGILFKRCMNPILRVDFLYRWTSTYRKEVKACNILRNFGAKILETRIKEREQSPQTNIDENEFNIKKRISFLDMLLECTIDGKPLTREEILDEINVFIFGGHDTTTSGICFTLYCLSRNQEAQEKCYQETQEILGPNKDVQPTCYHLNQMKYLEMVIKEALRLYPPIPGIARSLKEDFVYEDIVIPKGMDILMSPFLLHRDPKHFPEPDKFIPERFTLEECGKRHPYAYLPFSAGPRNCIGQKFAMYQMKACISTILRHYKLLPSIPEYELEIVPKVTIFAANGIKMRIEERL